jgi:hypothetical protein
MLAFENVNSDFWGLNFDIRGCFFIIESVLNRFSGDGGLIEIILSLLEKGALEGELEFCDADFRGDFLLGPCFGGLNTIF